MNLGAVLRKFFCCGRSNDVVPEAIEMSSIRSKRSSAVGSFAVTNVTAKPNTAQSQIRATLAQSNNQVNEGGPASPLSQTVVKEATPAPVVADFLAQVKRVEEVIDANAAHRRAQFGSLTVPAYYNVEKASAFATFRVPMAAPKPLTAKHNIESIRLQVAKYERALESSSSSEIARLTKDADPVAPYRKSVSREIAPTPSQAFRSIRLEKSDDVVQVSSPGRTRVTVRHNSAAASAHAHDRVKLRASSLVSVSRTAFQAQEQTAAKSVTVHRQGLTTIFEPRAAQPSNKRPVKVIDGLSVEGKTYGT